MELKEYLQILKKRFLLIVVVTVLATATAGVLSFFVLSPSYKSDISVIINKAKDEAKSSQNYNDIMMYQKLVKTYSTITTQRKVAEDVISKLNLDIKPKELIAMVSTAPKGDTQFLTITVNSKDASKAAKIANQIAKSLKEVSNDIMKEDNVQLVDEAELPTKPDSPKPYLNMAIAFFFGIMVSTGIAFLLEYMDNTVKSQEELEKLLDLPVLGAIPFEETK